MLRKSLIALLLLISLEEGYAITGYQIELLVFSHLTSSAAQSEEWPSINGYLPNISKAVNPYQLESTGDLKLVKQDDFSLKKERNKLDSNSTDYKVIAHFAWRESLMKISTPTTFHLYGGNLYDNQGHKLQQVDYKNSINNNQQQWELNGAFTISLQRYFNTNFNLIFAMPMKKFVALSGQGEVQSNGLKYIRLMQSRRTKSDELNYIDHPMYGVLLKITPVDDVFS